MAGLEVVGLVFALYPVVERAVKLYKDAKGDSSSRFVARRVESECMLFDQFVRRLLSRSMTEPQISRLLTSSPTDDNTARWRDPELLEKVQQQLGETRTAHILEHLLEMHKLLVAMRAEIVNISRGTEVLGKIRTSLRIARASNTKSGIPKRLQDLAQLREALSRLLGDELTHPAPPLTQPATATPRLNLVIHRDLQKPVEVFNVIRESYECNCQEPHLAKIRCRCKTCTEPYGQEQLLAPEWAFEVEFHRRQGPDAAAEIVAIVCPGLGHPGDEEAPSDQTATELPQEPSSQSESPQDTPSDSYDTDALDASGSTKVNPEVRPKTRVLTHLESCGLPYDGEQLIRDICSRLEAVDEIIMTEEKCLGILDTEETAYMLSINSTEPENTVVCLADMIGNSNPRLSRKKRMELAFRLSSAVLPLSRTPWIDDHWTSRDLWVDRATDEAEPEVPTHLFVRREFYSRHAPAKAQEKAPDTLWSIVGQPTLTRLGFYLIELIFGLSMQELRDEDPSLVPPEKHLGKLSTDLQNFFTAKALLKKGRIEGEAGPGYEAVVKACISHQYRDKSNLDWKVLDSEADSFLRCVEEVIIRPLYQLYHQGFR